MKKILTAIQEYIGSSRVDGFSIEITVNPRNISPKTIRILYYLINNFENYYFITFKNVPYCLMPDAIEHIIHEKVKDSRYYYDGICKSCYLNEECLGWSNLIHLKRETIKRPKQIPREIIIEVTNRCNLGCINCTGSKQRAIDISYRKVKRVIDETVKLGVKNVRFTGGEPLLHNEIEKMLIYAKNRGCYVTLNTNATLFNDRLIESISKNTDNILVSLQGFNQASDRRITKNYSLFKDKLSNIMKLKLKSSGIIRVGTVISKTLINNFKTYLRLIKKLGIGDWELYRPFTSNCHNESISKKDFRMLTNQIYHLRNKNLKIKIGNPLPFCLNDNQNLSKLFFLGGITDELRLVLDTDGHFKPNYFTSYELGKNLQNAWKKLTLINKQSRKGLHTRCQNCSSLKWCRGGFRMIKLRGNDTYFLKDPLAPEC